MQISKLKIVFLALSLPFCGHAQETWNLKKSIEYGLKNNRNNTIYSNEKLAADAKAREALADYLPQFSLTTTLDNNLKVQQTIIPAGVFGPDDMKVAFTKKYNLNATAQLDQTIYDQSLLTGLKANKYNKQQAELNIRQSREAIIYNICSAYFQILVYRQELALLNANGETYLNQAKLFELRVAKGVTLQKELDKVNVDYNNNLSRLRVSERNIQLAENELKYEMGYPIENPIIVETTDEQKTPEVLLREQTQDFSPATRVDYQLSEVNIKLLEINEKSIRADALPKLTAYARYGGVGFGDNVSQSFKEISDFSAVGLKLTIPILDFYRRNAQTRQAGYELANAEETLKLDQGRYRVEFENAKTKLIQAQVNVENDRRNIDLAESVFKTTDFQFQKGVTDLTDWLDTQNALREAQNHYLSSLYNFFIAKLDTEKAAGTLNTFYNSL